MMNLTIFILVTVLLVLIYILGQQIKRQQARRLKLDRSLDRQLLTMLGNDKKAALRILRNLRQNHPGRTYLWYHEKAIRDLLRDRRS